MGNSIPATGAVAFVVEPAAEDEVGGGAEEDTVEQRISRRSVQGRRQESTYMMIIQVKKPQCSDLLGLEPSFPPSSQANLVYQVIRRTSKPSSSL